MTFITAFPSPRNVALGSPAQYQAIGFSRQKVRALLTLARAIERRDVDIETLPRKDYVTVCGQLLALRGVGRWSDSLRYAARWAACTFSRAMMARAHRRGLRGGSVGRFRWTTPASAKRSRRGNLDAGLAYFHLLLDGLSNAGVLASVA